jgi:hypothetical protein
MEHHMNGQLSEAIQSWEAEGGASAALPRMHGPALTGSVAQVHWAEEIRRRVDAEFDRVVASFTSIAERQSGASRADTYVIIAILQEKRNEVLGREQAGYFIHHWQEINDQVRQMLFHDERFQTIRNSRPARAQTTL